MGEQTKRSVPLDTGKAIVLFTKTSVIYSRYILKISVICISKYLSLNSTGDSLDLRSHFPKGRDSEDFNLKSEVNDVATEIRYTHILNGVLPPDIRVLAWAPVETSFSC